MEEVRLGQEPVGLDEGGKGVEVVGLDGALELVILESFHRCKWCLGWCLEWGQDRKFQDLRPKAGGGGGGEGGERGFSMSTE